jgi:hypothetical protein
MLPANVLLLLALFMDYFPWNTAPLLLKISVISFLAVSTVDN